MNTNKKYIENHAGCTRQYTFIDLIHSMPKTFMAVSFMLALTACGGDSASDNVDATPQPVETPIEAVVKQFELVQGNDLNNGRHPLLSANPGGPGGSPNQSLRSGDVLAGDQQDNIIIGALGVDIIEGYEGDDIMIGGTEDFNSSVDGDDNGADNRDRAFGHAGDDTFIWAPGDGSDFFDGGDDVDVVIFGLLGEERDALGNTEGAPFFAVNPPNTEGSQDFDGIYLDNNNQPIVDVSGSPGFCSFEDAVTNQDIFQQLSIDHIVRFSLRNIANQFDAGQREDDDGLRVALTLKNVEFVVCTKRELDESDNANSIEVVDISGATPVAAEITDLPVYVQALIQ